MYVITGATGHIGSRIVDILLVRGEPVRVIGRDPAGCSGSLSGGPRRPWGIWRIVVS
jgi:nucleoside-diphosphate-sugar epimerase